MWFQREAKMVRKKDGRPWFLHGVGFDISELKRTENVLQELTLVLQNLSSRILRLRTKNADESDEEGLFLIYEDAGPLHYGRCVHCLTDCILRYLTKWASRRPRVGTSSDLRIEGSGSLRQNWLGDGRVFRVP